ncbi:hypothetical protein U9M48_003811 [Paspalum notatum var. saurae]|uniref:Uncharacterized protein n=1 Tax=Paspalum notatum var. saurae TaxID=547442 RepID=A0AAQ3PU97_PASNO
MPRHGHCSHKDTIVKKVGLDVEVVDVASHTTTPLNLDSLRLIDHGGKPAINGVVAFMGRWHSWGTKAVQEVAVFMRHKANCVRVAVSRGS